jgi:hypothetical protein
VLKTRIAAAAVLGVVTLGGGAAALATSGTAATSTGTAASFTACVGSGHKLTYLYRGAHSCARGLTKYTWSQTGPRGATGSRGATGATGPQGPAGPAGPAGTSAVLSVSATTSVTAWPESSGWANDNFTRTVTITRQHAAASSHCGGASTCWFYTESLADNGDFTTVSGATAPNGSNPVQINGIVSGNIVGGGSLEFYASSGSPSAAGVPATATGSSKPSSTTNWYQLFFPAGTTYGQAGTANDPWTTYSWVYTAPGTCEKWTDAILPGDDGQGSGDGNITGVNACAS